jgi:glutaminase
VQDYIEDLYREFAGLTEGKVATYIPELAKANPNWFGICLVTTSGAVYEAGDSRQPFTIQSISKPFVYGMALEDNGRPQVISKVGMEPTGDAFNSISLEAGTGRPRNPMINAGAIATTALIAGKSSQHKLRRLLDTFGTYAGRDLALDEAVYRSESDTGHRNRAIGYMLRNFEILAEDPMAAVELYFQQCSISVTCHDLGLMAATLANRGVNPLTGKQALRGEYVESVLSIMGSCGMYDYAGEWIYSVGMPAKSGVAGGLIAILPGQLGIGVFSPLLDARGNSVRGIRVCDALSRHCDLHLLNRPSIGKSAIRLTFSGTDFNSSRIRTPQETQLLHQLGGALRVYQLQGNLNFAATEVVVRDVFEQVESAEHIVFDFKRVLTINESACRLFYQILVKFAHLGKEVIFTHTETLPLLRRYMKIKLGPSRADLFRVIEDNDLALEWCENQLLQSSPSLSKKAAGVQRHQYDLFENFSEPELQTIGSFLKRRNFQQSETVIHSGDQAREIFFLARGGVSVFITLDHGARKRLATFSPGMAFGEMSFLDASPRSALIVADTEVECDVLDREDFERLGQTHLPLKTKLLENISLSLCRRLRKANRELSLFQ